MSLYTFKLFTDEGAIEMLWGGDDGAHVSDVIIYDGDNKKVNQIFLTDHAMRCLASALNSAAEYCTARINQQDPEDKDSGDIE